MKKIAYFTTSLKNIPGISNSELVYLFLVEPNDYAALYGYAHQVRFVTKENLARMLIPAFFDEIHVDADISLDMTSYVKNKFNLYKLGA